MNGRGDGMCRNCTERTATPTGLCMDCETLIPWCGWFVSENDYLHGASHAGTMEDPYPTTGEMGQ